MVSCPAGKSLRHTLIAALMVTLLHMHIIYLNLLYRDLFVPLFILAAALALRGGKGGFFEALLFGLVLGVAYFTRYQLLPALPIFFGVWLYSWSVQQKTICEDSTSKRYSSALFVIFAYGLLLGIWVLYGWASGFTWTKLFGFGISGGRVNGYGSMRE